MSLAIQRRARVEIRLLPFSQVAGSGYLTGLSQREVESGVHLVTPDGVEYHDGEAAMRALRLIRAGWLFAPLDLPGLRLLRDLAYRVVAANRGRIWRLVRPRH